jgi:hypothetical protein
MEVANDMNDSIRTLPFFFSKIFKKGCKQVWGIAGKMFDNLKIYFNIRQWTADEQSKLIVISTSSKFQNIKGKGKGSEPGETIHELCGV